MSLILLAAATVSAASTHILPSAAAADTETQEQQGQQCGLWLAPSPIKEQEDHGWGHSIFTGKLIPNGTVVLSSGIMDNDTSEASSSNDNKKVYGDLFIPIYDWESLDAGTYARMLQDDINTDDDTLSEEEKKERIKNNAQMAKIRAIANRGKVIDPPMFQETWNGNRHLELVLESYESMRIFMPGLANIPPCSATGFNLRQVPRQITHRDWRDTTTTSNAKGRNSSYHDGTTPSYQAGSFSYLSQTMWIAHRDIQPGEELVVECSDNSDEFDPKYYPPVDFKPSDAGGYAVCLDDKAEERLADHTPNIASIGSSGSGKSGTTGESYNGGGQRGLFAKRQLNIGEIITSTPMTPVHKDELIMDRKKYEKEKMNGQQQSGSQQRAKQKLNSAGQRRERQQLLLNYMFGHSESSLLWLPHAAMILAVNHYASYNDQNPKTGMQQQKLKQQQPNAKLQWHSDKYTEAQAAGEPLTRRQQFHHKELLDMDSLEVVQKQGMGLQLDLVVTRTIREGEEILIDYGTAWDDAMKNHKVQWESAIDAIELERKKDEAMREKRRKAERERKERRRARGETTGATTASGSSWQQQRKHRQTHMENSMTATPLSDYVTAADYNAMHERDIVRTVTEQHDKPYPSNIETACYFEYDWVDERDNELEGSDAVTYESWYHQNDYPACLLPCVITERRGYVPGEENKRKLYDDDDGDEYGSGDNTKNEKNEAKSGNITGRTLYGGSASPKRYTAKLIDTHEENTSIDFHCHIFKRFEYIYMDVPREAITFINKPHSTDHWIEQAFRQPIGLPDDMVPKAWRDLTRRKGNVRGGGNVAPRPKAAAAAADVEMIPTEKEEKAEKDYRLSVTRWNEVETRRERLKELEVKLDMSPWQEF
mmetsp:Transcript_36825/g.79497  ORF Transcript_36825/g.79497 Transcript_36825/m.79497 type:complete len:881 (+) Transcript_36825:58-2700(+)